MIESKNEKEKWIIGLVGGVASGKTAVAREMEKAGAIRVDADELARDAMKRNEVKEQIRTEFGPEFVTDGTVNRSMLADVVFEDQSKMKTLNGLIHPYVLDEIQETIQSFRNDDENKFLVLDVPLLVETDLDERCDVVVFLDAPEEVRARRVKEERGWSRNDLKRREEFQADLDLKRKKADYTIKTNQPEEITRQRARSILSELNNPSSSGEQH